MSQQFLKSLECLCIKGIEQTCPAGGFLEAEMTLKEASLVADIKSEDSRISSPGEKLSCTSTDVEVTGTGPYYEVTINSPTENIDGSCDFIEAGWELVVTRENFTGKQFEYYDVKRKNLDGTILVFGLSPFLLEEGVTFEFRGVGLIKRPDAILAKAFDQLLEATSEINKAHLGASLSIKPDEQPLETGTIYSFHLRPLQTVRSGEVTTVTFSGSALPIQNEYVTHLIKNNQSDATVVFRNELGDVISTGQFTGFVGESLADGFTLSGTTFPEDEVQEYLRAELIIDVRFKNIVMNEGSVLPDLTATYSVKESLEAEGVLDPGFTDKVVGDFGLFRCEQKLFPSGDRVIQEGFGSFVGPRKEQSNLFTFIDEGVFDGLMFDQKDASTLSDGTDSFIIPDSVHTEGLFQYKCNLTDFTVRPDHTRLHMRIAAPISNYESRIAPLYTVYNINLLDPSGNLVIKYKDFSLRGDSTDRNNNFGTYSTAPEYNLFTDYYDWNRPQKAHLYEGSGYSLSFSVRAVSLDDAFDFGFDEGFEENFVFPEIIADEDGNNYLALDGAPLSTQESRFINPTDAFRVSAVEICNSGGIGIRREQYLPIHIKVPTKGRRVEQDFLPSFLPLSNFDSTIWPSVSSVWSWSSDSSITNVNKCNAETMISAIKVNSPAQYITMDSAQGGGVADSGKLTIKFSNHKANVKDISKGAFNFAFDQSTKNTWWKPSGAFNVENSVDTKVKDISFFSVDTLTLKVLAKKQAGSRDYALDVVGYSDDKLLNRTSPSGGFIQDPSGIHLNNLIVTQQGQYPVVSGFKGNSNQFALGGRSISEHDDFFTSSGNDHYKLTQYPMVTGTDFELYEVPLKINPDVDKLGMLRDYTLSSLLEHVYLDIFPIPSGASIAHISLSVRYKPQDGLNMSTYGGPVARAQDGRREGALFPTSMGPLDNILNAGSGYAPLSRILDIPHSYRTPKTIKSNYARRWRGAEGTVRGPYDPDQFSFGFENPIIDYPFLSGYFKFDQVDGKYIKSSDLGPTDVTNPMGTLSGLIVGNTDIYHNVGWRFASGTLFQQHLPGYSGNYTTTDWTSLSKGSFNFVGDPMYGKIADAFDRTARVSGVHGNINFGNIDTTSGFAIFTRFTPDASISGQSHNLFNSGVLFAKWDTPSQLDFALGYKNGFLCAYAKDDEDDSIVEVVDTIPYSGYVYPLNILLTYNDHQSSGLKLYVDAENYFGDYESGDFDPSYDAPHLLRASSSKFYKKPTNGSLTLGWGAGSGVGINGFISEFGVSTWSSGADTLYGSGTNIVEANADRTYKQVTAKDFFDNLRVTFFNSGVPHGNDQFGLWDRVNENTFHDWQIGDFKYCEFSIAFDQWQKRPNREQIIFDIKHHGSGYSSRNDLSLPSSIDPRVSYHTQIENDFLRFHLSDVPDHFYSVNRRITKSLPAGYKFSERALVVESVIQHTTDHSIIWPHCDGKEGPRLVVSLYSKKQDPYWTEDEPNWGLVNRKIHNVEPSSCVMRLDTTFTYNDLVDTDEEWAIFPQEPRQTEFKEKYFSEDVNDMFVQYDLVYPSGKAFESKIQLHSSHVRMSDCNVLSRATSGSGNLYTVGALGVPSGTLNLNLPEIPVPTSGTLNLGINVPIPVDVQIPSGLPLNISGQYVERGFMILYTPEFNTQGELNLFMPDPADYTFTPVSGSLNFSIPTPIDRISEGDDSIKNKYLTYPSGFATSEAAETEAKRLGLSGSHQDFTSDVFFPGERSDWDENGDGYVDNSRIRGPYVPLFMLNTDDPKLDQLNLFTFAVGSGSGIRGILNLSVHNELPNSEPGPVSGSINLNVIGVPIFKQIRTNNNIPLYINAPNIISSNPLPLTLGFNEVDTPHSGEMNLYTASYNVGSKGFGSAYGMWNNNNYGTGIELQDNYLAKIEASNEIRGVDLFGYGSCTGDSPRKAFDSALITDGVKWRDATCNDGGIFRATHTYTNSGARNFSGDLGYSGNYYGIRKFTQLLPSRPYFTELTIKTGSTDPIKVPRTFEEWEYGMCGPDLMNDSGCCTADCDQNLMFSGVKLIGDDACGVPPSSNLCIDPETIVASGRNIADKYGYKVSVKGDLMAISAPKITIPEYDQYGGGHVGVPSGGSVFLYRRGADVAGKKASWELEEQLMLPTGFRKDYIEYTVQNLLKFDKFTISGVKWQIGQEGREFGSSLDMAVSGDVETIVVGAPRAKWTRQFNEITTSGVPCGTMVVADLFEYKESDIATIASTAKRFDILWKYFSAPWYGDCDLGCLPASQQFYPQIDMKTIVLQTTFAGRNYPKVPSDDTWFIHKYINRLDDFDLLVDVGSGVLGGEGTLSEFFRAGQPVVFNEMVSGMKSAFLEAFPYNTSLLYDGTPAIFGMFKEKSGSTAGALQYTDGDGIVHSLYDEFENFYNEYTFESGVYDQTTNLDASGHLNTVLGVSENWATTTVDLIRDTFDSGRLSRTKTNDTLNRDFITSGVGQEWGDSKAYDITQFQIPPHSGGRVYVFEKERDNFNCVQIISSPKNFTDFVAEEIEPDENENYLFYGREFNDRFGHSVGISANSEVISIGSPFTNSPCRIYEKDPNEQARVYAALSGWLVTNSKNAGLSHFHTIFTESGRLKAQESAYDFLTPSERLQFRLDNDSKPYKLSYKYGYGDINYVGTRQFLPTEFAPTSRLGWSTAVSDDGSSVAFGAPTDSFNEFEDANVYADNLDTWASYQHAGAVRMFEARKTFDHSGVVEFGRFGNLDRALHPNEVSQGFYDQMGLYFGVQDDLGDTKDFRRMDFSEIEIPRDAGLAFIITPEIDAVSDEIIDNIKNWLVLGDRHLVLVGNDPIWEENGVYSKSNDVINKILKELGSHMRITAAKNKEMSLPDCVSEEDKLDNKYNITPSLQPVHGAGSVSLRDNFYARGVGDIRINIEKYGYSNYEQYMNCPEGEDCEGNPFIVNERCEFPLKNSGDLRAEWHDTCIKTVGNKCRVVHYTQSWPLHFANYTPDCDSKPSQIINRPKFEPVPVLTTAEHLPARVITYPDTSGYSSKFKNIYETIIEDKFTPFARYSGEPEGSKYLPIESFKIKEDSDSNLEGTFNSFNLGALVDPDPKNERDGIVQGVAKTFDPDKPITYKRKDLYKPSTLVLSESGVKEDGTFNNSKVYLLASQWPEDDAARGLTFASENNDKNTEFYINMLKYDCDEVPRGWHLGGWTGNTSLKNAYYVNREVDAADSQHSLASKLRAEFQGRGANGYFKENMTIPADGDISQEVTFIWIANPEGLPSDKEVEKIKAWMNTGEKRLIITYTAADRQKAQLYASNVNEICEKLNISSRPFFVPNDGEFFVTPDPYLHYLKPYSLPGGNRESEQAQLTNTSTEPLSGCKDGYGFTPAYNDSTSVSGLWVSDKSNQAWRGHVATYGGEDETSSSNDLRVFVPISGGSNYENIIFYDEPIFTYIPNIPNPIWKIEGQSVIKFPTIPLSGYKLFFDWVSETAVEKESLLVEIEGINSFTPNACDYFPLHDKCHSENEGETEGEGDSTVGGMGLYLNKTPTMKPQYREDINFVAKGEEVTIKISAGARGEIQGDPLTPDTTPKTVRLLSVSGCPIPIDSGINFKRTERQKLVDRIEYDKKWTVFPGGSRVIPAVSRPVMHKSHDYCRPFPPETDEGCENFGNVLIEDGPVVVAEEYENFSSFPNGKSRSKIILISDSTMIQGQCPHYRSEASEGNQAFIRSLYPSRPSKEETRGLAEGEDFVFSITPLDNDSDQETVSSQGRNFYFTQKLRGPERGSPAKYHAASGMIPNMTEPLYTLGGSVGSLDTFYDNEDTYHPSDLTRPKEILRSEEIKQRKRDWGNDAKADYGVYPKFSGDFLNYVQTGPPKRDYADWPQNPLGIPEGKERKYILDAGIGGGLPELMKLNNTDYLDLDIYYSGCLGDLFGYSVDLVDNQLIVGSPFNGFVSSGTSVSGIVQWSEIKVDEPTDGLELAQDGGGGAAFYFEKTGSGQNVVSEFLPWEFGSKIKPSSVNVGIYDFGGDATTALTQQKGSHNIDDTSFIEEYAKRSDNFGFSVAIDYDMIAVGAPNHDYETLHHHIYSGVIHENGLSTAFQRKSFNAEYDIPQHSFYDLGDSGVRVDKFDNLSGTMVLNNGAVFNFRNELVDFANRTKNWIFAEKLYSQGYNDRGQSDYEPKFGSPGEYVVSVSGAENDRFGWSVCIDRAKRGDSGYTLVGGSPYHDWPTSGNHPTSGLNNAGSAYTFDAMLREQTPSIPNEGSWMDAHVFAQKVDAAENLFKRVYQNVTGDSVTHLVTGIIITNDNGDAFLEVSGFDPSTKGFVSHRPYVDSVKFVLATGTPSSGSMNLNISGSPVVVTDNMNLMLSGAPSANVYNSVNMYQFGALGTTPSGMFNGSPSGMNMFMAVPSGYSSGILNLNLTSTQTTGNLDLNIRGY